MENREGQRVPDVTFRTREGGQWKLHRDIWNSDAPPAR